MPEMATIEKPATEAAPESGASDPIEGARLPGNEETTQAPETQTEAETAVEESPTEVEAEAKTPEEEAAAKAEADKAAAEQAAAAAASKVWAEKYKTPEELETAFKQQSVAYDNSSKEGKRLNVALKETAANAQKEIDALKDQLAELKIVAEAGPEIKEPSDEELEAMGPIKATRLLNKIAEQKKGLAEAKSRNESRVKESKASAEAKFNRIFEKARAMATAKDEKGEPLFPGYSELTDSMDELMAFEPGVTGLEHTPEVLFYAAYGRRAIEREREGKVKTKESEAAAALKAKAAGAAAGAAGASGGAAKLPEAKKGEVDPDSDEAANDRLQKAYRRGNFEL